MVTPTESLEEYTYVRNPGQMLVLVLAVLVPGLVILACLCTSAFLCWYRDRIPIFRAKARKFARPGAKTRTPLSGGGGGAYPTQATVDTDAEAGGEGRGEGEEKGEFRDAGAEDYQLKSLGPARNDNEVVVAVDVSRSSQF